MQIQVAYVAQNNLFQARTYFSQSKHTGEKSSFTQSKSLERFHGNSITGTSYYFTIPLATGILNADDKCPKLNAPGDQVDDDGDGVGNLCDNCPRHYNALHNGKQVWPS